MESNFNNGKTHNEEVKILSQEEIRRRDRMLNGNSMSILFSIALPLVFYNYGRL